MSKSSPFSTNQWLHRRCAYEQTKLAMRRIPPSGLIEVDVDIPAVAKLVFGKIPRIRALRSAVASSLADFDMRTIDRIDLHLRAMCYAHSLYQSTRVPVKRLREWLGEWPAIHGRLVTEANRLLSSKSLDRCGITLCPNGASCHHHLNDIQRLCCLLHLNLCHVERVTTLRRYEIARADVLAELVAIASERRGDLGIVDSVVTLNRQRAFTRFMIDYDQVRRAMQFIRWNVGDAEVIAPALHRQASRRRPDSLPPISSKMPIAPVLGDESLLGAKRRKTAS